MRTPLKSILMAGMLPRYMTDETAGAAPSDDPNAGASAADASQESGTTQSATTATESADTDTTGAAAGEAGNASAANVSSDTSNMSPVTDATLTGGEQENAAAGADASTGATESAAASPSGNTFVPIDPPVTVLNTADAPTLAEVPAADTASTLSAQPGDTAALGTDANGTPIVPTAAVPGDSVQFPVEVHAEAKDRFAGVLAKLHQFEDEAIDELKEDLLAIGELLHLHSKASISAQTTGDYKADDLS